VYHIVHPFPEEAFPGEKEPAVLMRQPDDGLAKAGGTDDCASMAPQETEVIL
jgi:hypothetical protein